MFLLLRTMTLSRAASLFGALSFGLGGLLLGSMTMLPTFFVWAIAPLVGWAVVRAIEEQSAARISIAGLLAGMQLLIGEPMALAQVWFLLLVLCGVERPRSTRRAGALAATLVIAILVAAVQILPAIDHLRDSARSRGIAYETAGQFSMPLVRPLEIVVPHLFGVFDPFVNGYWGANAFDRRAPYLFSIYNGIAVAILVLAGFLMRARGWSLALVIALISYVLAIGDRTPIFRAMYNAGIARSIRYPEKFAALGIVTLTIFAAFVADRFLTGDPLARRAVISAAVIVVAVNVALWIWTFAPQSFLAFWRLPATQERLVSLARTLWMTGIAFAGIALCLAFAYPRRWWMPLAFLFVLADIAFVGNELVPRMPARFFTPPEVVSTFDRDRDAYAIMHRGNWTSADPNNHALRASFGPWFARNGLEPFTLANWGFRSALELDFDETALLPTHDLLDQMMKLGNAGFPRWAEQFAQISNVRYMIDYRPITEVVAERKAEKDARLVRVTKFRASARYYFPRGTPARILHIEEDGNSAAIDVECNDKALLIATVTRHKYWSAFVDGKPAAIEPVNIAYQAVRLPRGRHHIEFRYRNPLVIWMGGVSALTILVVAIVPTLRRRRLQTEL